MEFLGVCWVLPVKEEVDDCLFGGGGPLDPPFEIVDIRLWLGCGCWWWTTGLVSTSSLEKDVLSLFRLELEALLQKEEKPGTGLDAHPESMLDIEFLLPLVGLCSWDGVDTVEELRYGTYGSLNSCSFTSGLSLRAGRGT